MNEYMTIGDVANEAELSAYQVQSIVNKGMITGAFKGGPKNRWLVPRDSFNEWNSSRKIRKSKRGKIGQIERAVFDFLIRFAQENGGNSPSIREIGAEVGVSSTSQVEFYLRKLEQYGHITMAHNSQARSIQILGGRWEYTGPGITEE